ncbi:hypothetical protein DXV65_25260 [Pseudomonas fluorescens]|nr:hypothetical protein DXV65_25260 [Pseudomonas fluorescens]
MPENRALPPGNPRDRGQPCEQSADLAHQPRARRRLAFRHCAFQCGSGLARESGGSVSPSLTDPPLSRASPLPQLICSV